MRRAGSPRARRSSPANGSAAPTVAARLSAGRAHRAVDAAVVHPAATTPVYHGFVAALSPTIPRASAAPARRTSSRRSSRRRRSRRPSRRTAGRTGSARRRPATSHGLPNAAVPPTRALKTANDGARRRVRVVHEHLALRDCTSADDERVAECATSPPPATDARECRESCCRRTAPCRSRNRESGNANSAYDAVSVTGPTSVRELRAPRPGAACGRRCDSTCARCRPEPRTESARRALRCRTARRRTARG